MSETTTTTTTLPSRPISLKSVDTIRVTTNGEIIGTDSSDSKGTLNTINSKALSFGPLAPGQTSETMIVYLKVPNSSAINNIKIALIDCGGLTFGETKFCIETYSFLDYNIIPTSEFLGVNSTDDSESIYNVDIANKDWYTSQYVYLNVVIPQGQLLGSGTIKYRWFMDYA